MPFSMPVPLRMPSLTPEAEPIALRAADIYQRHTEPWFIGLIVHGSAVKGGFIEGCSDIDFQLYLTAGAFAAHGSLPVEVGLAIQNDLAQIDPTPFRYIQCYALPAHGREDFTGPIPGTYQILAGSLPVAEANAAELLRAAQTALDALVPTPDYISHGLLEHGGGRLQSYVRLLCTDVWPTLFHILTVESGTPVAVWNLRKADAVAQVSEGTSIGAAIRAFDDAVRAYYPEERSVDDALQVIDTGIHFLHAATRWWKDARKR